ncbi:MAG: hypothetical protein NTX91_05255 [candidate division SR1 bacterium]|nr:hypothetical protein [candidate division SR1 bacterium]
MKTDAIFTKEKISQYLENKRQKLSEQGYDKKTIRKEYIHSLYERIKFGDKQEYTREEIQGQMIQELIKALPRDQLMGTHETIPVYFTGGAGCDSTNSLDLKIKERKMQQEEYDHIMSEVQKYGQ